jgi:hypothetical protein
MPAGTLYECCSPPTWTSLTPMPPKPKRRGLRPVFAGLRSLFSSEEHPRDEEPVTLKMSTVEASASNAHASAPLGELEGSTGGAATTGMSNASREGPLASHSSVDPPSAESARQHSLPPQDNQFMSMFKNAQKFKIDSVNVNVHSPHHVHNSQDSGKQGMSK